MDFRIYGVGDYNYQNMKKSGPLNLGVDCEAIVAIDINASYLSIGHGISGYPLPQRDDLYNIGGLVRAIVKAWVFSTTDNHCVPSRYPRSLNQQDKGAGIETPKEATMPPQQPNLVAIVY